MPTAEKSFLSREDVCSIIETSAKARVVELKFNGLHVVFGRTADKQVIENNSYPFVHQAPAIPSVKDLTEDQHRQQTKEAIEADEVSLREDQLARLLVEDPVRYEQLISAGELTDVASADTDDE